ncbi:MAG: hypothetical protein BGO51_06470 [Rhodospirillales bacterium 69-11]|nr:hypothetical protein [Rhodospirillales bacterium]MBN8929913.1 hypothetical protein [Rhodospirillales bacterium]OJW23953.1 MAG: hypothetical protein BGO51_06470 [Rhodospirillales bacterium 69-11]
MTLAQVLALRPTEGGAATYQRALADAEARRAELLAEAEQAEHERQAGLLHLDDKQLSKLEEAAAGARRMAARVEALLPLIHDDMAKAAARETVAELEAGAPEVAAAIAALNRWVATRPAEIQALMREGVDLQNSAIAAFARYQDQVDEAYRNPAVRALGPLNIDLGQMPVRAMLPNNLYFGRLL